MASDTPASTHAAPRASQPALPRARKLRLFGGGTSGNERLTAISGSILIPLLAVIGVTIIDLRGLLWVHLFVGLVLIGPVALKLASTLYRFGRYYTQDVAYRAEGPPIAFLRALGPLVVLTTLIVFASGVALLFAGPSSRSTLLPIHKISFIVWAVFTGVHLLAHLPALPAALRGDYGPHRAVLGPRVAGRDGRTLALAGALVAGVVLALVLVGEFSAWTSSSAIFHHHGH